MAACPREAFQDRGGSGRRFRHEGNVARRACGFLLLLLARIAHPPIHPRSWTTFLVRHFGPLCVSRPPPQQIPSSNSFNYSTSSTSSRGRGRGGLGGLGLQMQSGGSDSLDPSLRSNSLHAAADDEVRRAESLVGVIDRHPELEGSHSELVDSFRSASLRDTGSSTLRTTSLRDTGSSMSSMDSMGSRRRVRSLAVDFTVQSRRLWFSLAFFCSCGA